MNHDFGSSIEFSSNVGSINYSNDFFQASILSSGDIRAAVGVMSLVIKGRVKK